MGPPIIELEFEKDILDPHIIIGGESIQLKMTKEKPLVYRKRKIYVAATKGQQKGRKTREEQVEKQTHRQITKALQ